MGRRSSIRKLSPELRKEIDRMLMDDRLTHEEISSFVRERGANISESAVQRYNAQMREVTKDIRIAREMAIAVGRELEELPDGSDPSLLIVQSLQSLIIKIRMSMSGETVDSALLARLASATRDLASARKLNVDVELKIADRVLKKAASALEREAKARGMRAETITALKAGVLGVRAELASGRVAQPAATSTPSPEASK